MKSESEKLVADQQNTAIVSTTSWDAKCFGFNTGMISDLALSAGGKGEILIKMIDDWAVAYDIKCMTIAIRAADLVAIHLLESADYHYYETRLCPTLKLNNYVIGEENILPLRIADPSDYETIKQIAYRSIKSGHFHHDRHLSIELASSRYREWAHNLIVEGTNDIYVLDEAPGRVIAFAICKQVDNVADLVLGGFAEENKYSGQGAGFILGMLKHLKNKGVKIVVTTISLNNLLILSLYSRLRFKFTKPEITLRKWY